MRSELVRCSFRTIARMLLTQEPLTDEDLDDVVEFVRVSNPFAQQTWGWDTGRFVDWRWGSNSRTEAAKPGWFEEHGRVFCSGSEIVAVAIAEYGGDDVCIITQGPNAAVIDWVLAALTDRRSDGGAGLRFEVAHTAEWLRPIFGRFGLVETTRTGTEWEYDLATVPPAADLAPGFVIEALAVERSDDYAAIADCINRAFDQRARHSASARESRSEPVLPAGAQRLRQESRRTHSRILSGHRRSVERCVRDRSGLHGP